MHPAEIAQSYDAIAHRWLEPHLESNGIRQHEHALHFRSGGGAALDVGSGCNGRFIRLLESHGYIVEGLDISAQMIALAKARNPHVTFYHEDVCEWAPSRQYDFITAWDSIWHVPLAQSENVLRKLCRALAPGGVFIWTTAGLDASEEKRDSAMGPPVYYSVLGTPKTLEIIAAEDCVCRHLEYDQPPEKHLFLIAQKV
ncbi:Methyltransferase type 11 [Chthoniobacter flavus Ellin428]|uniref:Methyltransferase type 11 n=1 Tax=Chthoniobacter flavus Ellin428 TaxID=497964 RepID=B4D4C5_9BACT|nr:class I SAM-dependent methyltransferase [Chthoniobacter flavus]EDY18726.1 Methyltransferase type 11 [Chthoniobacter flavus Ellin428]TCO89034.1 methyltransferase family protein [Chthoniobacter flavus]